MAKLVVSDLAIARPGRSGAPPIIDRISFELESGATLALAGPSGAGKTTLLHAVAGLLRPEHGRVLWNSENIAALAEPRRDAWRRNTVGLIFQDFQLLPELSAIDNIMLPLTLDRWRAPAEGRERAHDLARRVGLSNLAMRAGLMSRGEQQRVALARALMRKPALLIADEPTASLDPVNAARAADLLVEIARENAASLLVASHDRAILDRMQATRRIESGRLVGTDAVVRLAVAGSDRERVQRSEARL